MANSVVEKNEIFLNGVYYPITRPIRSTLASIYHQGLQPALIHHIVG